MFDFVIGGLLGSYGSQRQYYNNDNDLRMIRCFSGPTHMPAAPGGAEGCWHLCRALFLLYNYKCAPFYYVCIFHLGFFRTDKYTLLCKALGIGRSDISVDIIRLCVLLNQVRFH